MVAVVPPSGQVLTLVVKFDIGHTGTLDWFDHVTVTGDEVSLQGKSPRHHHVKLKVGII